MSWTAAVNERSLHVVAEAIGLTVRADGTLTPCPACGAEKRDQGAHRGPIGTRGAGWMCHRCKLKGGPLDLVAAAMFQRAVEPGERQRWAELRAECQRLGLLANQKPVRMTEGPRVVPVERHPPSAREVLELWTGATRAVVEDEPVSRWITHRNLDPTLVAERDLARALRTDVRLPEWCMRGERSWSEAPQQWRVLVPMFDARGDLRSVHARALRPRAPEGKDKATLPRGCSSRGFVMANNLGRMLLAGNPTAETAVRRSDASIPSHGPRHAFGVVVVEGIPDFLTASTTWASRPFPAVFGIVNGSWTEELAARIPDRTTVLIATDPDEEGERYAAVIRESLLERCPLLRWWSTDDVNAGGLAAGGVHLIAGAQQESEPRARTQGISRSIG